MSRWHDASTDGIARWANLPPEERVADRVADILTAADDIRGMLHEIRGDPLLALQVESAAEAIDETARSIMLVLPGPGASPERDSVVQSVLDDVAAWLQSSPQVRDLRALQAFLAPYAALLYYEVRRLEYLLGR